jgi:hypothetical protein
LDDCAARESDTRVVALLAVVEETERAMKLYDLLQFSVCIFSIIAAGFWLRSATTTLPNLTENLRWDGPISRRAKEPVTMERSRGGVCRYGGFFPIACRCAAVSSIKLTYCPFGIAFQTQSAMRCVGDPGRRRARWLHERPAAPSRFSRCDQFRFWHRSGPTRLTATSAIDPKRPL